MADEVQTFEFPGSDGKTYLIDMPKGSTREQAFTALQDQVNPNRPPAADKPLVDPLAQVAGVPQRGESKQSLRESAVGAVKSWFEPREAKDVSLGELGGAVVGGAAAGAAGGAVLPRAMQAVGKFIPGGPGRLVQGAGAAMELIPTGERIARGAAGGAFMAGAEKGGEAAGLSPAATTALGFGVGVAADTATGFAMKEVGKLVRFAASLGDTRSLSQAPKRALSEASAKALQKQLFGEKTAGYIDALTSSDNRIALQEQLRREDPSLVQGVRPLALRPEAEAKPIPPGLTTLQATAKPGAFDATKAAAMRKGAEATAQKAVDASTIYRERVFQGVTQAVMQGKRFSETPGFRALAGELQLRVATKEITQKDANDLLQVLANDRSSNPKLLERYAKSVDDQIRQWGQEAERGGQVGAKAISANTSKEIRGQLREAYNQYLQGIGMGRLEQRYREVYSAERLAEAKDKLPLFLNGLAEKKEFDKFASSLARDPAGKPFIQRTLMQHLSQQEPQNVMREFERLQSVLVKAELVTPAHLSHLRTAAEQVQKTVDKGAQLRAADRFKRLVMATAVEKVGSEAGQAAGRRVEGE